MYFKIGVLKSFGLVTGKHMCWSLLLITLQAFFDRTSLVAAFCCFKKLISFSGKHQWLTLNRFIFLVNTTESNNVSMSYQIIGVPYRST